MIKSLENWVYLKKKINHTQYQQGMSMNDYIHAFDRIVAVLLDLDENRALWLLNSLLGDYGHLTTTLLYDKDI